MVDYFAPRGGYAQQPAFLPPEPEMTQEERQSVLGLMYESSLGGLGYIGKLLDKTFGGRAVRGLLGGRPEELLSILPLSDTLGITDDANTVQGTDLLADAGLITRGDNGFLNTVAGLGVEMALDPSTYLGIGPLTKAGQAAAKAGTATKGLAAGIRAGERGLVGFGLPFQRPAEELIFGTGEGAARAVDTAGTYARAAVSKPLDLAQWAAGPTEGIFGVNPVAKAREVGAATGRAVGALFDPAKQGAYSAPGQDIAENTYTSTLKQYGKPGKELFGDVAETVTTLGQKYGPEAQQDILRAMTLGIELPNDITPFVKRLDDEFERTVKGVIEDPTAMTPQQIADAKSKLGFAPAKSAVAPGPVSPASSIRDAVAQAVGGRMADKGDGIYEVAHGGRYIEVTPVSSDRAAISFGILDDEPGVRAVGPAKAAGLGLNKGTKAIFDDLKAIATEMKAAGKSIEYDVLPVVGKGGRSSRGDVYDRLLEGIGFEKVQAGDSTKSTVWSPKKAVPQIEFETVAGTQGHWANAAPNGPGNFVPHSPAVQAKIDAAAAARDDLLNRLQLGQQYRQQNDPTALLAKHLSPDELLVVQGKMDAARQFLDTAMDERTRKGIKSAELQDVINYLPRQKQSLGRGEGEGFINFLKRRSSEGSAASDPTQIRRMDALRNLPGGTDQWEQIVADPALRSLAPDAKEARLREILSGTTDPVKSSPVWEQAKEMRGLLDSLDPRYGQDGQKYFTPDTALVLKQYGEGFAKKMAITESVYDGATRFSLTKAELDAKGGQGVRVGDLLDRIGADSPSKAKQVWEPIASKLGVPLKDVADRYVPADVASDMMRMGVAWKTPEALAPVVQAYDMALNMFKTGVTSVFPSFYVRNLMGGLFNSWRGDGLGIKSMSDTQAVLRGGLLSPETTADLAAKLPQYFKGKTPEQATAEFKKLALGYGVAFGREGQVSGDLLGGGDRLLPYQLPDNTKGAAKPLKDVASDFASVLKPQADLKAQGYGTARQYLDPTAIEGVGASENVNRFVAAGRAVGRQSEDFLRGSHFLEKMKQGFKPEVAAEEVAKYHIDYGNLTQFEKNVMKRLAPWYSFTRRNLPPILEDLVSQPAKIAQTTRAITGARDPDQFTPQYIAEGASFPLGESGPGTNRFISSFGLPVEDEAIKTLGSALSGDYRRVLQQVGGMGLPYLKAPAEIAFDTQLYSGRRLSDLEPSKVASLGGMLPDQAAQLATQFVANTPFARGVSTIDRFLDSRKGVAATGLNALTGLRVSDVDTERARLAAERQMLQDLLRPSNRTRVREEVYVPKDQLDKLTPDERFIYEMMKGVQRDAQQFAKRPRE